MRYRDLRDYLAEATPQDTFGYIEWVAGPDWSVDQSTGQTVVLTRMGGDGMSIEGLFDGVGYQVLVIGEQNDYDSAERLADHIDALLRATYTRNIGTTRVSHTRRIGSPPTAVLVDDAIRTHFVCSYVIDVGLTPIP